MSPSPFLRAIKEHMLVNRYSKRTIDSSLYWIKYFIISRKNQHLTKLQKNAVAIVVLELVFRPERKLIRSALFALLFIQIPVNLANADSTNTLETSMTATGSFDIQMTPQKHDTVDVGRIVIHKQYQGDMVGDGAGQMLSKRTNVEGSAGYVAMEHFTGVVNGLHGSFTLQHNGVMNRGAQSLTIIVVPDSGTEDFKGISGTMQIDISNGEHSYVLDYEIEQGN